MPNYKVADISLASFGRKEIELAEVSSPPDRVPLFFRWQSKKKLESFISGC